MAAAEDPVHEYTEADLDRFLEVGTALAKEAGEIISSAILATDSGVVSSDLKSARDCSEGTGAAVLTETDPKVERHLVDGLRKAFPDHRFIGEEDISSTPSGLVEHFTNAPTWIIDPIDGTMNFIHKNPLVVTSMGLTINKKLVLGIVNNPMTGNLYSAVTGKGAFVQPTGGGGGQRRRLKASGIKKLEQAMVLMEISVRANEDKTRKCRDNIANLMSKAQAIRCPGPAALDIAWVGAGSADCFFHAGIHCWDMAAGAVIVRESGGVVTGTDGGPFDLMGRGLIAAATPELAKELAQNIDPYTSCGRDMAEGCIV